MDDPKYIRISLNRLAVGKMFARDLFLNMPKNGKLIRLVATGDEIRPSLLERLFKAEGIVLAQMAPGDSESPDLFPLYVAALSPGPALLFLAPQEPVETLPQPTTIEELKKTILTSKSTEMAESIRAARDQAEELAHTILSSEDPESASSAHAMAALMEESVRVSGSQDEESVQRFAQLAKALQEHEQRFKGSESASDQTLTLIRGSTEPEESVAIFSSDASELPFSSSKLEGKLAELVQQLENINYPPVADDVAPILQLVMNSQRIYEIASASGEKASFGLISESLDQAVIALGASPNLKAMAESTRIQDGLALLAGEFTELAHSKSNSRDLAQPIPPPVIAYKELPVIAGRMATFLGHSLGYVDVTFLSDLALTTLLHFSKKNGKAIEAKPPSRLAELVLNDVKVKSDSPLRDSKEIINFLEAYFQNPECDRTQRDLSLRTFLSTAESFDKDEMENSWNFSRWKQFVEDGPTLAARSVCARASAKATRDSKEFLAS